MAGTERTADDGVSANGAERLTPPAFEQEQRVQRVKEEATQDGQDTSKPKAEEKLNQDG